MNRRRFLRGAVLGSIAPLTGCRFSLEQGLMNDCRVPGRHRIMGSALVKSAWEDVDPAAVWDCHAHVFGNGRSGSGVYLNVEFDRPSTLAGLARRTFFLNAACAGEDEDTLDQAVVRRLTHLADELPEGAKVMLLAFDFAHDADGRRREDLTTFAVPDAHVASIARERPDRFEWIASIHPFRKDALQALGSARLAGARAVKWLPQAMDIDPAHPRCRPFYRELHRLGMPLLVHSGEEQAVPGAERQAYGNPLLLRHPLRAGVDVVAAHCASLGDSPDLDRDPDPRVAPRARNSELFARLLSEPGGERLYGDLSAITQANRAGIVPEILEAHAWHPRLLNGSDYPLPGILPLFSLKGLVRAGLLEESALPVLQELRHVNPIAFDFVLKRTLAWRGRRFPASVFETRRFFDRPGRA